MNRLMTRRLEMAARVQEFHRSHPFTDRTQTAVVARFAERLSEAKALVLAEHAQQTAETLATRQRHDVRRHLEVRLMPAVARVGAFATRNDVDVASRFRLPAMNGSQADFVTQASSLLEAARAHQEALTKHGLTRALLNDFAASVTRFHTATEEAMAARQQVSATRAKLENTLADLNQLVSVLDALNRVRFGHDAGLMAMWAGLRTVGRPPVKRSRKAVGAPSPVAPSPVSVAPPVSALSVPVSAPVSAPVIPAGPPPASPPAAPAAPPDTTATGEGDAAGGGDQPPRDGGLSHAA